MQQRRARVLVGVLIVVALALITMDFRGGDAGPLERLRGGATVVLRPLQDGVAAIVRPFDDLGDNVRDLVSTRTENQSLRERITALEERRASSVDLERENRELRSLLEMRDRTELGTVVARTVALAPSSFEWTITIDAGSSDGVARDMPVIDGDGLVGRVIQVTPDASRVLLSIDPNFSAAGRTARTGEIGPIDGRGGDPMIMRPLDPQADIEVGDEVVTSSYAGGLFPAGIPIGTVQQVVETGSRLSREVLVSPFVDFTRLHHVMVVLTDGVEELPPFEGTEGLEFTRPPVSSSREDGDDDTGGGSDAGTDTEDGT